VGLRTTGRRLSPRCVTSCRTPARTSASPVLRLTVAWPAIGGWWSTKEPAEIEPPLSKIITSQGRTRRACAYVAAGITRCPDSPGGGADCGMLANGWMASRGNRPSIKRSRRPAKSLRLFGHASPKSTTPIRARRCAEHLHHLAQAPAGSRVFRPRTASRRGDIAESDGICVHNR
jgi:hypothetical protein